MDSPPSPPANAAQLPRCVTCGYDLENSFVGGVCPECATPVMQSLRSAAVAPPPSSKAKTSLWLGITSLALFVLIGAIGIPLAIAALCVRWSLSRDVKADKASPYDLTYSRPGAICAIVQLVLSALFLLFLIYMMLQ